MWGCAVPIGLGPFPEGPKVKGHKRPLATLMQGAVLALPNQRRAPTPVAFVIGLLNFVSI